MSKTKYILKQIIRKLSPYTYIDVHKINQPNICIKTNKKCNNYNRDMLPVGMSFVGNYDKKEHKCTIDKNGTYLVKGKQYLSLSEAAKSVTHVRTEGWRFWKLYNKGPSVLDMFRKRGAK